MAPSAVDTAPVETPIRTKPTPTEAATAAASSSSSSSSVHREPQKTTGVLDQYEWFDTTPVIGREFPKADLVEWWNAPNADELLRDLAITISERGVVFFRAQDKLTNDLQKKLMLRLGELTGRPHENSLHIHPLLNNARDLGGDDPEISTISSVQFRKLYNNKTESAEGISLKKQNNAQWHSDIAFEPCPADYTCLRLTQLPKTGGDTVWASGYEVYDRISPPYQAFLESLSATFKGHQFNDVAQRLGLDLYADARGSPQNVGTVLQAVHPVVRTNPVTGWKSIFPVGGFARHINGLTPDESDHLLKWFLDLVYRNHDLQVRLKWQNENDIAIWDNRSVYHSMTLDYHDLGDRFGNRAVGIGERPYFDPQSKSRREDLGIAYIQRD